MSFDNIFEGCIDTLDPIALTDLEFASSWSWCISLMNCVRFQICDSCKFSISVNATIVNTRCLAAANFI